MPDRLHDTYWEFATGPIADVAADLVGPDVVFHHSKLNFKWDAGSDDVKWHQDIQFYPHTNYSPMTIGTYLADTGMDDGPLMVIPGSHDGPLFDQYDGEGHWIGCLSAEDSATVDVGRVEYLTGPAGSITAHNCRTVHGSPPTSRPSGRPLLLNAYASADAFSYTAHPQPTRNTGKVIRGQPARWAHHDPPTVPDPAGLVGRVRVDLRRSGRGRLSQTNSAFRRRGGGTIAILHGTLLLSSEKGCVCQTLAI